MSYAVPEDYAPLTTETITRFLGDVPKIAAMLGGDPANWHASEVGDGNLNLVFIVHGENAAIVAKQALPYVRLVGDSWPLPLSRAHFEHEALIRQAEAAPGRTPEVLHYDHEMALIVMEYLTPHIILRKGLIAGGRYPHLADHAGRFMAETLFRYSDLALDGETKKKNAALFADNHVMCSLTEQVIFDDPYFEAELNRHTSPQLDSIAADIRSDDALKIAIQELKTIFMGKSETLIHGDLHTGSIMVTEDDTRVIDPEFAFYGPMGFDVGALMANLLLAYFAQSGHASADDDRKDYKEWILETLLETWRVFETRFGELFRENRVGTLYPETLFAKNDNPAIERALARYLDSVRRDAIGFTGAKMLRRILGIAHVEDLETIEDPEKRAASERRALDLARVLITDREKIGGYPDVVRMARALNI